MDPVGNGWRVSDGELVPVWFEGESLPTDEEYDNHLRQKLLMSVAKELEEQDTDESETELESESESDFCESDEYSR